MNNIITVGRRLIATDQIAFIEPFDPKSASGIDSNRPFKARINLLNRDSCLTETPLETLVQEHNFLPLAEDGIAINPRIDYRVERFEPTDDFAPAKAFKTRLLWNDPRGNASSKLLVAEPEAVLAAVTGGNTAKAVEQESETPNRSSRRRSSKRPSRQPA